MKDRKLIVNKLVVACASFFAFAMVVFPDITEAGSKTAIIIWANSIVPVLLPFFIFSDFIKRTGDLKKLPPRIYPFVMAFLSGSLFRRENGCSATRWSQALLLCSLLWENS